VPPRPDRVISSILRHDRKQNSYKIALLRALNDAVLSFPDMLAYDRNIAIPLRVLARYWLAYFWPFADPSAPIYQGQRRSLAAGGLAQDMEFRPALEALRTEWEAVIGQPAKPSDGFVVIADLMVERKRSGYPPSFVAAYRRVLAGIEQAVKQPIRYAGEGSWGTFDQPAQFLSLGPDVVGVPGTQPSDVCVVVRAELWQTFADLSLWIEALCLHEWCLYSETVIQPSGPTVDRGHVYRLLTDRPDNRRPLTWERNGVDLLLLEGTVFECPWTGRRIGRGARYDLDHLVPLTVYPMNDLWNLVPADEWFNQHRKRDRLPSASALVAATPRLELAYAHYGGKAYLAEALARDVRGRFSALDDHDAENAPAIAHAVSGYLAQLAEARNIARFEVA
jgi:hypothetical protein